jgi:hypothetical protein
MRVGFLAFALLLAGSLHGCGSGPTGRLPDRPITDDTPPVGYDCSGDQPTDPCIIQPEPTFP